MVYFASIFAIFVIRFVEASDHAQGRGIFFPKDPATLQGSSDGPAAVGPGTSAAPYPCTDNDGQVGICVSIRECPNLIEKLRRKRPSVCGWDGEGFRKPLVCCVFDSDGGEVKIPPPVTGNIGSKPVEVPQVLPTPPHVTVPPTTLPPPTPPPPPPKVPEVPISPNLSSHGTNSLQAGDGEDIDHLIAQAFGVESLDKLKDLPVANFDGLSANNTASNSTRPT